MAWTAEQREAAQKALAESRCPDCGLKGTIAYAAVGPFRWKSLYCASCEGLYSLASCWWDWCFFSIFGRLWDGRAYCEEHA